MKIFSKKVIIFDFLICLSIMFAITLIDQATKSIAFVHMQAGHNYQIIKKVLSFEIYFNNGIAYGLFAGMGVLILVFSLLAVGFLAYLITQVDLQKKKLYSSSVIFLMGGAMGNLIDRIILGYVIDFIHFDFMQNWRFGDFYCNLADVYLTAGIVCYLVYSLIELFKDRKKSSVKVDGNVILKQNQND